MIIYIHLQWGLFFVLSGLPKKTSTLLVEVAIEVGIALLFPTKLRDGEAEEDLHVRLSGILQLTRGWPSLYPHKPWQTLWLLELYQNLEPNIPKIQGATDGRGFLQNHCC